MKTSHPQTSRPKTSRPKTSRPKTSAAAAPALPPRLSDAALLLLGQAAARQDRLLLPPPAALRTRGSALQKVLQALLKAELVVEVPVEAEAQSWRVGEDDRRIGLAIAPEGFRAIGLPVPAPIAPATADPGRTTKHATLIARLSAEGGASIVALADMLAWQNHTVRAALTGLRQKGHLLAKTKDASGTTLYRITGRADAATLTATGA